MSQSSTLTPPFAVLESCLYVDDLAAAKQFYTEILNLELASEDPERHLFYRCGDGMVLIFLPEVTSRSDASLPRHGMTGAGHIAFAVPQTEISAWREKLKAHSITIEKEHTWPNGGLSLYFRDPAGNSLELSSPSIWGISG